MKKILFIAFILFSIVTNAQNVFIPDTNFKNALLSDIAVNGNLDGQIQVSEANAFSGILYVNSKNITDLTGIEAFINMTGLQCNDNQITTIDLSNSPNLTLLGCGSNQLTSLNVNGNSNLSILGVNFNNLTTIDVSNNTSLTQLFVAYNSISTINLSNNINLNQLEVSYNPITFLDLSNNINLNNLTLKNTAITTLDLSSNYFNLQIIYLDSNNLSTLNLKSGNNTDIFFLSMYYNPNLTCIQVDDSAYSTTNWTNIDPQSFFSTNCGVGINENDNFNELVTVYPNPASYYFNIEISSTDLNELYLAQLIDVTGKVVQQELVGEGISRISIAKLPKGYYSVFISNSSGFVATKKLIITH